MVSSGNGSANDGIAKRWLELQGKDSWKGLLEPLDMDLRKSIISYGELVAATGDGFNSDKQSQHGGLCLYGHDDLLARCGVAAAGHYKVTKFVYATEKLDLFPSLTPTNKNEGTKYSNWIGYVAVATDEGVAALGRRDILVAWRGSVKDMEWVKDLEYGMTPANPVLGSAASAKHPSAKVHFGFLSLYLSSDPMANLELGRISARDQVLGEVRRLMVLHRDEVTSITIAGHSLGASLATLNAVDIAASGLNKPPPTSCQLPCPVTAILFASPQVGNDAFKEAFHSFTDLRALHVKNVNDLVPKLPKLIDPQYVDVPVAVLPIDTTLSSYLKDHKVLRMAHDLQCNLLHGVSGEVGGDGGGEFKLVKGFDLQSYLKAVGMALGLDQPSYLKALAMAHDLQCYLHGVSGEVGGDGGGEFKLVVDRDPALVNKYEDALKDDYRVPQKWWSVLQQRSMLVKNHQGEWEVQDFDHY